MDMVQYKLQSLQTTEDRERMRYNMQNRHTFIKMSLNRLEAALNPPGDPLCTNTFAVRSELIAPVHTLALKNMSGLRSSVPKPHTYGIVGAFSSSRLPLYSPVSY